MLPTFEFPPCICKVEKAGISVTGRKTVFYHFYRRIKKRLI